MKRVLIVLAVLALLPVAAQADTIQAGDWISLSQNDLHEQTNGGGPFWVSKTVGNQVFPNLFLTFCIEFNEHFSWNTLYKVDAISTNAVNGGVSGYDPSVGGDPLDPMTAYLYTHFRNGDYTPGTTGLATLAEVYRGMQAAIWVIEGEQDAGYLAGNFGTFFYAAANTAVNVNQTWSGLGGVRAMNLYDAAGGRAQDQLTIVPEPASMMLLGGGLLGLAGAVRRRRRT